MQTSYSHKRSVSITLDLNVYDDFDVRDFDFREFLELEGDESLEISINDYSEFEVN